MNLLILQLITTPFCILIALEPDHCQSNTSHSFVRDCVALNDFYSLRSSVSVCISN